MGTLQTQTKMKIRSQVSILTKTVASLLILDVCLDWIGLRVQKLRKKWKNYLFIRAFLTNAFFLQLCEKLFSFPSFFLFRFKQISSVGNKIPPAVLMMQLTNITSLLWTTACRFQYFDVSIILGMQNKGVWNGSPGQQYFQVANTALKAGWLNKCQDLLLNQETLNCKMLKLTQSALFPFWSL